MTTKRDWTRTKKAPWPERFWRQVEKSDGCWNWTAASNPGGYGLIRIDGRLCKAARVCLALHGIEIPEGACVLHHCDNPRCVNPDHLFIGTHQDNMADMCAKGRQQQDERSSARLHPEATPRGVTHYAARLTEEDVREIRRLADAGHTHRALAARYGVSHQNINAITARKTWRHVE